jgi:hypothetical protein
MMVTKCGEHTRVAKLRPDRQGRKRLLTNRLLDVELVPPKCVKIAASADHVNANSVVWVVGDFQFNADFRALVSSVAVIP